MDNATLTIHLPGERELILVQGDLTLERTDAIVNAANQYLMHGGGVAGAIIVRGGESIQDESTAWVRQHGPVSHAEPAVTGAGKLACRYVIHAVGPVWGEGDENAKLAAAVRGSLLAAGRLGLASLSLPAISTGIFGFPAERAAGVILTAIRDTFTANPDLSLRLVRMVIYDAATLSIFRKGWSHAEA